MDAALGGQRRRIGADRPARLKKSQFPDGVLTRTLPGNYTHLGGDRRQGQFDKLPAA